jgi:sucrose-phosphate synthase
MPDVLISSLGTKIHYSQELTEDDFWAEHIDHLWQPKRVRKLLSELPGLKPQAMIEQSFFKIAYHYDPNKAPSVEEIYELLHKHELTCNVVHAFGQYLDILPSRASKGQALRYVAQRWEIPLHHILVAGGSGADEDMMRGNTLAVVVANRHHEELSHMIDHERIYFANQAHALGILEAIDHYDFFHTCDVPVNP